MTRNGNSVYFINPPSRVNQIEVISEGLFVVDYKLRFEGINHLPLFFRNVFSKIEIERIRQLCSIDEIDVIWSFDPFRFQNLNLFKAALKIFHPVDLHHTKLDRVAAKSADIVLSTSKLILAKYKIYNRHTYIVNHGLANHFLNFESKEASTTYRNKINVGYVGNLHYRYIDVERLISIVTQNSHVKFHFIGPSEASNLSSALLNLDLIEFLQQADNCILHGVVQSNEIPDMINHMDAFLMAYEGDSFKTELSNPHKLIEYLSTGKVVVCHNIDEYQDKKELIAMVSENSELPEKFNEVINDLERYNHIDLVNKRKAWAAENSYKNQLAKIEELINLNG